MDKGQELKDLIEDVKHWRRIYLHKGKIPVIVVSSQIAQEAARQLGQNWKNLIFDFDIEIVVTAP